MNPKMSALPHERSNAKATTIQSGDVSRKIGIGEADAMSCRREQRADAARSQHPQHAPGQRQHDALDKQQAQDPGAAGAERDSRGNLASPADAADEHEVRHVGAHDRAGASLPSHSAARWPAACTSARRTASATSGSPSRAEPPRRAGCCASSRCRQLLGLGGDGGDATDPAGRRPNPPQHRRLACAERKSNPRSCGCIITGMNRSIAMLTIDP